MGIPNHSKRRRDTLADPEYPGVKRPHERDPGGNALPPDLEDAQWPTEAYPDDGWTIAGGGITAPSVQDAATADRNIGHDNTNDWPAEAAIADPRLRWDEEYGYAGVGGLENAVPHDATEVRRELRQFAASSYKDAVLMRNVGTASTYNTYSIVASVGGPTDPLPLLGEDWARKRAVIRSLASNTLNAIIGNENVVSVTPGGTGLPSAGAGGFILEPGKDLIVENTESVVAVVPGGTAGTIVITVMNESYER